MAIEPKVRYKIGYSFIVNVGMLALVNISYTVISTVIEMRREKRSSYSPQLSGVMYVSLGPAPYLAS